MEPTTKHAPTRGNEGIADDRRAGAPDGTAERFSEELAQAEHENLRERIRRLEASIASWAADLDEVHAENERLAAERDDLRDRLDRAEHARLVAEDARATLEVVVEDRFERIQVLEGELQGAERRELEAQAVRTRLHALRVRVRSRLVARRREIEELGRLLEVGYAERVQVVQELRLVEEDRERDARYLDKLEAKLSRATREGASADA